MTEDEFLKRQADEAVECISQTVNEVHDTLRKAASLEDFTRRHPWVAVGAAMLTGYSTAALVVPRKGESFTEHFGGLARRLTAAMPGQSQSAMSNDFRSDIVAAAVDILRPVLVTFTERFLESVRAGLQSQQQPRTTGARHEM